MNDPDDEVFIKAARRLKAQAGVDKVRKITLLKMYGSVIWYKGKRHDIFINRLQIRCRYENELAQYLKKLALQDEPK